MYRSICWSSRPSITVSVTVEGVGDNIISHLVIWDEECGGGLKTQKHHKQNLHFVLLPLAGTAYVQDWL